MQTSASHARTFPLTQTIDLYSAYQNLFSMNPADFLSVQVHFCMLTFRSKFIGTRHSSWPRVDLFWSLALRARTILSACRPFITSGLFSVSWVDRFYHLRTSARRTRGPSSFAWTTPSRTRTIFILEDPGVYVRLTFSSRVDPSLIKRAFYPDPFQLIYHDTRKPSWFTRAL